MSQPVRAFWSDGPSHHPAWLDPAFRGGHNMWPDETELNARLLAPRDSRRWVCRTCGAEAVPTANWGLPTGALAVPCGAAA